MKPTISPAPPATAQVSGTEATVAIPLEAAPVTLSTSWGSWLLAICFVPFSAWVLWTSWKWRQERRRMHF